eukprot:6353207-Amphidinium_carterae.1
MLEASLGSLDALALKLVAGRFTESPFPEGVIYEARMQWFSALGNELEVCRKVEGQPFYLDALSASLKRIGDPDWKIYGRDAKINYQDGVPVGDDGTVLPRTPAVFERKRKWRSLDEGEFMPE